MLRFVFGFAIATLLTAFLPASLNAQRLCGILDGPDCLPNTVCGILEGPDCIPDGQFTVGQNFQVTIGTMAAAEATKPSGDLNTLRDLAAALRACWMPPDADNALAGMQMSARFAFNRAGHLIGKPRMTFATSGASEATAMFIWTRSTVRWRRARLSSSRNPLPARSPDDRFRSELSMTASRSGRPDCKSCHGCAVSPLAARLADNRI